MANSKKLARRKAAGDDPTALSQSNSTFAGAIPSQPMPGMPQGPGNMMGDPRNIAGQQGAESPMSSFDPNNPQSPYGDPVFGPEVKAQLGNNVLINGPSGRNQNEVMGAPTGLNRDYLGQIPGPDDEVGKRLEPYYMQQQAAERAVKLYGEGEFPSYGVSLMGPIGRQGNMAGAIDAMNPGQSLDYLDLNGLPDVQQAGMNTGTGKRNDTKGVA